MSNALTDLFDTLPGRYLWTVALNPGGKMSNDVMNINCKAFFKPDTQRESIFYACREKATIIRALKVVGNKRSKPLQKMAESLPPTYVYSLDYTLTAR